MSHRERLLSTTSSNWPRLKWPQPSWARHRLTILLKPRSSVMVPGLFVGFFHHPAVVTASFFSVTSNSFYEDTVIAELYTEDIL